MKANIYQQENCVFIEGPRENLTQITDEFLFKITGIEGVNYINSKRNIK